jgi:hypothetical protein
MKRMPHKTLILDYKEVLMLCSEIIAVYCGVENPVLCGGTFVVATAQLTFLPPTLSGDPLHIISRVISTGLSGI